MSVQLAYIDPSVMTFAIQAIAGAAIAVASVVIVLWRRANKKVSQKLGLEEKSRKEVEEDIVVTEDPAAEPAAAAVQTADTAAPAAETADSSEQ